MENEEFETGILPILKIGTTYPYNLDEIDKINERFNYDFTLGILGNHCSAIFGVADYEKVNKVQVEGTDQIYDFYKLDRQDAEGLQFYLRFSLENNMDYDRFFRAIKEYNDYKKQFEINFNLLAIHSNSFENYLCTYEELMRLVKATGFKDYKVGLIDGKLTAIVGLPKSDSDFDKVQFLGKPEVYDFIQVEEEMIKNSNMHFILHLFAEGKMQEVSNELINILNNNINNAGVAYLNFKVHSDDEVENIKTKIKRRNNNQH